MTFWRATHRRNLIPSLEQQMMPSSGVFCSPVMPSDACALLLKDQLASCIACPQMEIKLWASCPFVGFVSTLSVHKIHFYTISTGVKCWAPYDCLWWGRNRQGHFLRECDCVTQGSVYDLDSLAKGEPQAVLYTATTRITLTMAPFYLNLPSASDPSWSVHTGKCPNTQNFLEVWGRCALEYLNYIKLLSAKAAC